MLEVGWVGAVTPWSQTTPPTFDDVLDGLLEVATARPSWMASGACIDDPEAPAAWFPSRGGRGGTYAKAVCAGCPVLEACRSWALERPELAGVWGGLAERERDQLRRR